MDVHGAPSAICLSRGEDHAIPACQAELDARIVELEDKIRFGSIALREEKMVVNDINKLRGQREKIKEFELHKASLVELEAENKKVKAVIEEMDGETTAHADDPLNPVHTPPRDHEHTLVHAPPRNIHTRVHMCFALTGDLRRLTDLTAGEFSIIKGERDTASGIIKDFWTQLKAAEGEAAKVEYEQKEAVDKKNEALEALEAARREMDNGMVDYRDNRKFSLQVRDQGLVWVYFACFGGRF